jgi:hypothetical protein
MNTGQRTNGHRPTVEYEIVEIVCEEAMILITPTKGGDPSIFGQVALKMSGSFTVYAYTKLDAKGREYFVGYKIACKGGYGSSTNPPRERVLRLVREWQRGVSSRLCQRPVAMYLQGVYHEEQREKALQAH